ncbi:hypothetical protein D3C84_491030 [compost metagenome]
MTTQPGKWQRQQRQPEHTSTPVLTDFIVFRGITLVILLNRNQLDTNDCLIGVFVEVALAVIAIGRCGHGTVSADIDSIGNVIIEAILLAYLGALVIQPTDEIVDVPVITGHSIEQECLVQTIGTAIDDVVILVTRITPTHDHIVIVDCRRF